MNRPLVDSMYDAIVDPTRCIRVSFRFTRSTADVPLVGSIPIPV